MRDGPPKKFGGKWLGIVADRQRNIFSPVALSSYFRNLVPTRPGIVGTTCCATFVYWHNKREERDNIKFVASRRLTLFV